MARRNRAFRFGQALHGRNAINYCSDAVAWLLEAGGAGTLVDKPRMRCFWTPTDIAKWCDRLVIASNNKISKSAQRTRGFTGNNLDFTEHDWKYSALATCS